MAKKADRGRKPPLSEYARFFLMLLTPSALIVFMSRENLPELPLVPLALLAFTIQIPFTLFIFPASWWRLSPARQPDSLVGRLLAGRLECSPRNAVLRVYILLAIAAFFTAFGPLYMLYLLVASPLFLLRLAWERFRGRLKDEARLRGVALALAAVILLGASLLAPLRAVLVALFFLFGAGSELAATFTGYDGGARFDLWVAAAGVAASCLLVGLDLLWRLDQARQTDNLPTSKARSASVGLVELQGVARAIGSRDHAILSSRSDMSTHFSPKQKLSSFYLEDDTGRIRVDPAGSRVRTGWVSDLASVFRVREVLLDRRVSREDEDDVELRSLRDGDPVYVLGSATIDPDAPADAADSARLVVRPSPGTTLGGALWTWFFGSAQEGPRGRAYHNVFVVADGTSESARARIMRGARTVATFGAVWLGLSLWLGWSARHRLEHYRVVHRRTPIPGPVPAVLQESLYQRAR